MKNLSFFFKPRHWHIAMALVIVALLSGWKMKDAEVTWKDISDGYFKTRPVGAIAVADTNVVYAGMVRIPGGYFMMGSNEGSENEKPVHKVYVDDFYMDIYEVTVEQYAKFLQVNPSQPKPDHWGEQSQNPNRPVVYVSWDDANAYAQWAGKKLPTEAQWEYAARGGLDGKIYPWGNASPEGKANYGNSWWGSDWAAGPGKYLRNVGSYEKNGYGLYDMAGNVFEWCADWYDAKHYQNFQTASANNPTGPATGKYRVLRGGSWNHGANILRCANRRGAYPTTPRLGMRGFRCVQDVL